MLCRTAPRGAAGMVTHLRRSLIGIPVLVLAVASVQAQGTRFLRRPTGSKDVHAFE